MNFAEPGAVFCATTGLTYPPPVGCTEAPFAFSGSPTSFTFGGFFGFNMQFGTTVAGVEADVAWKRGSISQTLFTAAVVPGPPGPPPSFTPTFATRNEAFYGSMTQGADGSARIRFGTLVTPWTLAYATAGGALGNVCDSFSYASTLTGGVVATASGAASSCQTRAGYTVGGGVETAIPVGFAPIPFGTGAKVRFEYRYTDLGTFSRDVPLAATGPCGGPFACAGNAHIDMRAAFHTFRVGLGFNFGEPIAPVYGITR
jgi:outer membrane immunogenic protein